jgi:GT2 family glycosyltransferase
MAKNDISIGIPFCTEDVIITIKAMLKQEYPGRMEILVAYDNPSVPLDKKIASFLKKNNVRLIINPVNIGLAATYNVLIQSAKYENVYLMHEDCVPQKKDLMKNSLRALAENPNSVINATTIIPLEMWRDYNFWNKILTYRYINKKSPALAKASLFNKSVFEKIGYFDGDTFRTAGEDIDFGLRMEKAGIAYKTIPDLVVHNHKIKNSSFLKVLRKEWQMGEAHGTCKRKYNFKKIGRFDLEIRLSFFLIALLGIFTFWPLAVAGIAPFLLIPLIQAVRGFRTHRWLAGLFTYPFFGFVILLTQTSAGVRGFITKKQKSQYYGRK